MIRNGFRYGVVCFSIKFRDEGRVEFGKEDIQTVQCSLQTFVIGEVIRNLQWNAIYSYIYIA